MTDDELIHYCGLADWSPELQAKFITTLEPKKRALIERMSVVEVELALWQQGLGPKPTGVIICHEHKGHRHG